jgi:hypothetical protein
MEDRQDIHCMPNTESILDDKYSPVLGASLMKGKTTLINTTFFFIK